MAQKCEDKLDIDSVVVDVKSFDSVAIVEDNLWNFVVKIMVQVQPDHLKSTASAECPSIDQESSCARTCSVLESLSSTIHTIFSRTQHVTLSRAGVSQEFSVVMSLHARQRCW